jgi:tetratricopeptide (TPR) repeat protein
VNPDPPHAASGHGDPEPGEKIGRFEVIESIARGGMATVLAVRDPSTGERVALKLLLPLAHAEESRSRFRREFRALSRLSHPNILDVKEWGLLGDRPWFTMELLEGHDLREEGKLLAALPLAERIERVEHILLGVTRALAYIHERGMIHRDVTPGNIHIGPDGVVKLMDFGVVKEMGAELTAVGEVVGTVAYMPPEQIRGEAIDARADLYSLGAVLYLMLTGKRPFSAHTIHGFMEKHLNAVPTRPSQLQPGIPSHLETICLRLLEKEPGARYASAAHLLYVLGDSEIGEEVDGSFPPRMVGRTLQRAVLREAVQDAATGLGGKALLLTAPTGMGKSRLLELGMHWGRRLGLPVASGRCRVQDRPFGAFVGVYRALAPIAGDHELLAEVFGSNADGSKQWERYAVITAFKELVLEAAPCVLCIDNLHRADPATIELLTYLLRNCLELAAEPVVFLLGHDSAESTLRRQLESLPSVEPMELPALSQVEVEELVVSILDDSSSSLTLARRLYRESDGSPAFISDMLRGLMDDGLIVHDVESTGGWRLALDASQITRSRLPMPASLRQALEDRLAPLSPTAIELGRTLALARTRLDLDTLILVAKMPEDDVMDALDELVDADIVEEHRVGDTEQVELSHGRFRDVLLDLWDPLALRVGHQRLGEALERQHRDRIDQVVEELAYHFEQAGLASKAYAYLVRTATRHLSRSLFEESLVFLDRALSIEPDARAFVMLEVADQQLAEVWLAISQARYQLGQRERAMEATTKAEALARVLRDPRLQSRVALELGVQLRHQGLADEAGEKLREAVARAEEAGDQTLVTAPLYQLGGVLWSRGDLVGAETHWRRSLQLAQVVGDERAQGNGFNGLAILAICRGQSLEARKHLEQSARLFERLGMLSPLVIARGNLIELYMNTGILRKALVLADRMVAQCEEVGHVQGIAVGRSWRARCLTTLGRHDDARRANRDALRVVQELALREDEAFARANEVLIERADGRLDRALEACEGLLSLLAIHDHEGIYEEVRAWNAELLARLDRRGDAERVLNETIPPREEPWPHISIRIHLARGRAQVALDDHDAAQYHLGKALQAAEADGYRYFQLLAHLDLARVVDDDARDRHLRVARGLARSLAANLPKDDADRFLASHGGDGLG